MRRHGNRVFLTTEEAVALLPEQPHTFRGSLPMLLGADITPERAREMIDSATVVELSGPFTADMGHGLTLWWHKDGRVVDGLAMSTDAERFEAAQRAGMALPEYTAEEVQGE